MPNESYFPKTIPYTFAATLVAAILSMVGVLTASLLSGRAFNTVPAPQMASPVEVQTIKQPARPVHTNNATDRNPGKMNPPEVHNSYFDSQTSGLSEPRAGRGIANSRDQQTARARSYEEPVNTVVRAPSMDLSRPQPIRKAIPHPRAEDNYKKEKFTVEVTAQGTYANR